MVATGSDVALGFTLSIAAGLATVVGGMVIFSKRLVYLANPASLCIGVSVASGVMIFISFVEIFMKAVDGIKEGIQTEDMSDATADGHAWLLATLCYLGGIIIIYAVDVVVHYISPASHDEPEEQLQNLQHLRESFAKEGEYVEPVSPNISKSNPEELEAQNQKKMESFAHLNRTGVLTAIAIGLHNIPEGIATYVGVLNDTKVGLSLCIGIAIHNLPEGLAVAAPVYFATGSRFKGILWCFISALAEPFGAFLAWIAIGDGMDVGTEGVLFGFVCGMMGGIIFKELLPTAFKFANGKTHYISFGLLAGNFIMAASLIAFAYAGV